jgi:hypothetical protein
MDHAAVNDELGLDTLGTIHSEQPQATCIAHITSARKHAEKRTMKMVLANLRRMASWNLVEAEHTFILG